MANWWRKTRGQRVATGIAATVLLVGLLGCDSVSATPTDAGTTGDGPAARDAHVDAALDQLGADDAAVDAAREDAAGTEASGDAGTTDDAAVDAASEDAALTDASGDASTPRCNSTVGLTSPLSTCSASAPCIHPILGSTPITTPIDMAVCSTSDPSRTYFDDGLPLAWVDLDGVSRYTCVFRPPGAGPGAPRPLVIFFNGAGGNASGVYDHTSLRLNATSFDFYLGVNSGFTLASVQSRNLHWPYGAQDGSHQDILHRDLGSPSTNPDIANVDRLIDMLAADGSVDGERVYVMGWSNGGFFAQEYAIARRVTPTPGGHHVAAAAVYSAADPFNDTNPGEVPSCRLDPYPTSTVPILVVGRSCDIVACDEEQAVDLLAKGVLAAGAPGFTVSTWMTDLATRVQDVNAVRRIVSAQGDTVNSCLGPTFCSSTLAYLNHLRWPDGVADGSGINHELDMLGFLRDHPLP